MLNKVSSCEYGKYYINVNNIQESWKVFYKTKNSQASKIVDTLNVSK